MGHDYRGRLARAATEAAGAGLDALVISPSPDLVYLTGYDALPLERLTALVVAADRDPVMLVPELERPRAAASPAGSLVELATWGETQDQFQALRALLPN